MLDVLILGAGPAGLYAADRLSAEGHRVAVADRMASPARKFLMAGRGGLNLTHSEDLPRFLSRYREAEPFLAPMIEAFPPAKLTGWCEGLGQETFTGTSGRVFPKAMKASPLLRALLGRLRQNGVTLMMRHSFTGFAQEETAGQSRTRESAPESTLAVQLETATGETITVPARAVLLALGGASWPKLGSNAAWCPALEDKGVALHPFKPANCGFQIAWSAVLKERFAGAPLKRIGLRLGDDTVLGEAVISDQGLEGGAVYALSAAIREAIACEGSARIALDLRPAASEETLAQKLARPRGKQSWATFLKKTLKLLPAEQALLREAGPLPGSAEALAGLIKSLPLSCKAPYDISRAISSAGGVPLDAVAGDLMLKAVPGVFAAGEMLDWEAPTGGYLLQACFATAHRASDGLMAYLETAAGKDLK